MAILLALAVGFGNASFGQTNFATLAADGAWTWFNDPRAIFHHGVLYFGCVRALDGKSLLNAFNLQSGLTTNLWTSTLAETDDHDVAGLQVKPDGTLLAVWARHGSDQFFSYRSSSSANPVAPADWDAEQTISNSGAGLTYANPFQLAAESGTIYNFCRDLNFNPTVFTSTNGGATWSTPRLMIKTGTGSTRPYVKYCSDYNSRIDFLYTDAHPDNYTCSLYHMYYQGGSFHQTDGTFITNFASLPILHDAGQRGAVVYQYNAAASSDPNQWIATARAWCWEVAYQTNGAPACVFQTKVDAVTGTNWFDARIYYYYARWTGTNWQKRFIAQAGRPLYNGQPDYGGGIALDPQDVNTIYLATDAANPFDLTTVTNVPLGGHYEIWKGVTSDGGLTFNWQAMTTNSTMDNLRPYVPRRFGGEPCVLWFRGTYTSYTSFSTSIVGLFTTQVPQTNAAGGTWSADANGNWSDNAKWLNGIVAVGAGNAADFSTLDITADRTVTLDSPRTIGSLRFGDASGSQNWVLNASGGAALTLNSGSTASPVIVVNTNSATLQLTLAGSSGFTKSGPGTLILTGSNSLTGTLNLDTGSGTANDGAVRVTSSAALARVASPITFRNNSGSQAVGSLQMDGTAGGIIVTQNFSTTCRNNNATPTFESLAGTNTLAGTNFCQSGGTNVIYQSDAGSRLQITAPIQYVGTLTAARTFTFSGAGDIVVIGPILRSITNAPAGVMKTGAGTLTLGAVNTYTNATFVLGGTLNFNGTNNVGPMLVAVGQLGGTGVMGGPVTIQPGGVLAPGNPGVGTLTINNALTNSGVIFIRLNKSNSALTNSMLQGVSNFSIGGTLSVTNIGSGIVTAGDSFKLFSATNVTGSFATILPVTPGVGLKWNTNALAGGGILSVELGEIHPQITQTFMGATNLVFSGNGGAAGYGYSVLTTTNLLQPLSEWRQAGAGNFDAGGSFSFASAINPDAPCNFYVIQVP